MKKITRIVGKVLKAIAWFFATLIFLLILYILFNLNLFHSTKKLTADRLQSYLEKIDTTKSDPYRFIADKFDTHSVVFIGEIHKRKQDLEFLARLIPYLYSSKKINIIGWEFGANEFQKEADSVVTAKDFDRKKAISIMRRSYYEWCYEEYLQIFKVIWRVNNGIPAGEDKIRFLQLNKPFVPKRWFSKDATVMFAERRMSFDNVMPGIVEKEVLQKNKKILVYCGLHHSFTRFKTPKLFFKKNDEDRAGQKLYEKYGDKIYQVCLLSAFPERWSLYKSVRGKQPGFVYPFDGVFNQLYDSLKKPFAIEATRTVFSGLKDYNSYYAFDHWKGVKFSEFCDGFIMLCPFDKVDPVARINDWLSDNADMEEVKSILPDEDARKIRKIRDLQDYINYEGNTNVIIEAHKLKKFW